MVEKDFTPRRVGCGFVLGWVGEEEEEVEEWSAGWAVSCYAVAELVNENFQRAENENPVRCGRKSFCLERRSLKRCGVWFVGWVRFSSVQWDAGEAEKAKQGGVGIQKSLLCGYAVSRQGQVPM